MHRDKLSMQTKQVHLIYNTIQMNMHMFVCRCMSVCGHVGGKQCALYHISQMVPMYLAIVYISAVP